MSRANTVIPVVGKLSDQFGRKSFFVVGVVLFLAGSALCGAAQTIEQLIAFRALQGLGAGFGISLGYTLLYLSLIVLIPVSALFIKATGMGWEAESQGRGQG